jgi:hypothetical protein
MSNTIRLTSAAVAVAAATALVLAVIALVTAGDDEKSRTIELVTISDPRAEAYADLGERGDSAADLATFSEEARQDGKPVGRTFGSCTVSGTEREPRGVCSLTTELDEGKIAAAGTIDFRREDQPQDIPIVGGTGEFENASGTVTLGRAGQETPLTITVTTPDGD